MLYTDAVRELVTNPRAVSIVFRGQDNKFRKIIARGITNKSNIRSENEYNMELVFVEKNQKPKLVMGCYADFLLRDDFIVEYKKAEETQSSEEAVKQAFNSFKEAMVKLGYTV